jgi:hypothetical protein
VPDPAIEKGPRQSSPACDRPPFDDRPPKVDEEGDMADERIERMGEA